MPVAPRPKNNSVLPTTEQDQSSSPTDQTIFRSETSLARMIALSLSDEVAGKYHTTLKSCMCPDHYYRGRTCKHMKRLMEGKHPDGEGEATVGPNQRDMEDGQHASNE
jgi:hypothetical protein